MSRVNKGTPNQMLHQTPRKAGPLVSYIGRRQRAHHMGGGLVGTWRKLTVNGHPLTEGYEVLRLNANGTASIECGWEGEVSVVQHRWQRTDERHWRLDMLIPGGSLPGQSGEVVIPGPLHMILDLSPTAMRLTSEFPDEVRAEAHRWLVREGHMESSEPPPAADIEVYVRVAEPGAAADGGGHIGFWDFKLTVAPAAAELGRSAAEGVAIHS